MKKKITKEFLINFETEIKKIYNKGSIRGPIHLSGNNEDSLIKNFKKIKKKKIGFYLPGEVIITQFYMDLIHLGLKKKY